jgi:hypothetical protein
MRKIIYHYHLFKNAGTSVDEMLKANFGARWVTREFEGGPGVMKTQAAEWIRSQPEAVAFSSHTSQLPPPHLAGVQVFPIVFVRHPVDRIASAYAFECRQPGNGFGAVLARNTTLAGYIQVRLSLGFDRQCRDFHCARLAQMFNPNEGSEPERALRAVNALPFVGLVEEYDASIRRLCDWLRPSFPPLTELVVARNVSSDRPGSLAERLEKIRAEIGDALFATLLEVNCADMAVFDAVRSRFGNPQ